MEPLGPGFPDPFSRDRAFAKTFWSAILATALFRCWHILVFFAAWSTAICVISDTTKSLAIAPTLLTVLGTVLGFVISYRTTSSFERYNEGRRYWSQIVFSSRTMARLIWFHVPARVLIEKKTVLNLIDAFGVAVKHYLRGEEDITYLDLYHTTKYLPPYTLPTGLPSTTNMTAPPASPSLQHEHVIRRRSAERDQGDLTEQAPRRPSAAESSSNLPFPATTPGLVEPKSGKMEYLDASSKPRTSSSTMKSGGSVADPDDILRPARLPLKYSLLDFFPFSLMVNFLRRRGRKVGGKKLALKQAQLHHHAVTHNIPLEISLYISSYISSLQTRKCLDPATTAGLLNALNSLVDSLTGLERILTTPIPFSYSMHLWTVTVIYCFFLPFQLWASLRYITIPGTIIASFIFFGFLVAGEEIESYDKNDLDLDHFTNGILRKELAAICAMPTPDPKDWVFSPSNNRIFNAHIRSAERVTPEEWVRRGQGSLRVALSGVDHSRVDH
ncbi:Bestrophin, RFP-TM, chloride channel-domain-containing protein [Russula dissimulans]|nr:Bestrophin, RFP-TM, chloride channel-domain-containing protein [Russula dissimulans]